MTQTMIITTLFVLPVALIVYRLLQLIKLYRNEQPFTDNFVARVTRNYRDQINKAMKLANKTK